MTRQSYVHSVNQKAPDSSFIIEQKSCLVFAVVKYPKALILINQYLLW